MSVEANIVSREKPDVILVPANAVINSSLHTVENGRTRLRKVEIGIRAPALWRLLRALLKANWCLPGNDEHQDWIARTFAGGRNRPTVKLVLTIAWTHVRHRARQTLVAIAGVVTGVGFSIMMAAMMEGSQDDFIKTLSMPYRIFQ